MSIIKRRLHWGNGGQMENPISKGSYGFLPILQGI